jgi:5'-nucleotidase
MGVNWSVFLGTAAAVCSALSFLPQVLKVRRQGGRDLSVATLALLLTGAVLWFIYGIVNQATAVAVANTVIIVLVSSVAIMRARFDGARAGPLRIAIDMDEVMADALSEHVRRYNAAYGASITTDDLQGRHLEDCVPAVRRAATEAMLDASFFDTLAVMPDCQDVVRELAARHEVFIVSAAMDVPCSFAAKYRWLRLHFPFIAPTNIVFCGDKHVIDADYLIDDRARHFARFKGKPLLFSAPHNAAETRYPRVGSWRDVREHFARLESGRGARGLAAASSEPIRTATVGSAGD